MQKLKLLLLVLPLFFFLVQGCAKMDNTVGPTDPPTSGVLKAIIGINDNPTSAVDSALTNNNIIFNGSRSTGNPSSYFWKMYRLRTQQLVDTAVGKTPVKMYSSPDTLIVWLIVTNQIGLKDSTMMTLRLLSVFGAGTSTVGDVRLLSSTLVSANKWGYWIALPKKRVPSGSLLDPATIGTHNNPSGTWTVKTPIPNPNDTTPTGDWKFYVEFLNGENLRFNYMGSRIAGNWSLADSNSSLGIALSYYKTVGENTYGMSFNGGSIYRLGQGPSVVMPPGSYKDTVVVIDATADSLIIYPNLRLIPNQSGTAWYEMNLFNFVRKTMPLSSYVAYGRIAIPTQLIREFANLVEFRFGGDAMADMTLSNLYSVVRQMISFQVIAPNKPGQVNRYVKTM